MVKAKRSNVFVPGPLDQSLTGPTALAFKAMRLEDDVVRMAPYRVIRHAEMQDFWRKALKKDEVSWEIFWHHFPEKLPADVLVGTNFRSEAERTKFQNAIHVVGAPSYVTTAMIDAAFPPGSTIQETISRSLGKDSFTISASSVRPCSALQRSGFWERKPSTLPNIIGVAREVEAELAASSGQYSSVAHIQGHLGSAAMSVATHAANRLLTTGRWRQAVYVSLKGARSAETAGARVASALGILSYPVITNEILRLTTYLHAITQAGRLGIVLDAEGCIRNDELHGISVLVTTLVKAGGTNVQVISAGEGSLELSHSISCAIFPVQPPSREQELAFLQAQIPGESVKDSIPLVAAACGHQTALLELVAANLHRRTTAPQDFVQAVGNSLLDKPKACSHVASVITRVVKQMLNQGQQDALVKLSVLPVSFTLQAASVVLGMTEIEALELLMSLEERDITRHNRAFNRFSCNPQMMVGLCEEAQGSGAQLRAAAITAFAEYCLHVADNAAALNASNAQVAAMRLIDRERAAFDELVNLLDSGSPLPAVCHATYADIVSKHLDLLGFRLSFRQQQELCVACAQASKASQDILGEAKALQYLGTAVTNTAEQTMVKAMGTVERALTPNHPVIAEILLSRAHLQIQAGNYAKAERLLKRCLEIQQRHSGSGNSLAIANTQSRLGGVCINQGNPAGAMMHLQLALKSIEEGMGRMHPETALAQCRLASSMADLKNFAEAHQLYLRALDVWRESLGHCHPHFAILLGQLAFCCVQLQRAEDAENYYSRRMAMGKFLIALVKDLTGTRRILSKQKQGALLTRRRSIEMWKEMHILDQPELQHDLQALTALLHKTGRREEAALYQSQALRLSEAVKAAHDRSSQRGNSSRTSRFARLIIKPLKTFCMTSPRTGQIVVLPAGIQDADLEELRLATQTQQVPATEAPEAKVEEQQDADDGPELVDEGIQEYPPVQISILADARVLQHDQEGTEAEAQPQVVAVDFDEAPQQSNEVSYEPSRETGDAPAEAGEAEGQKEKDVDAKSLEDGESLEQLIPFSKRPPFVSGPFKERVKDPKVRLVPVSFLDNKTAGPSKRARTSPRKGEKPLSGSDRSSERGSDKGKAPEVVPSAAAVSMAAKKLMVDPSTSPGGQGKLGDMAAESNGYDSPQNEEDLIRAHKTEAPTAPQQQGDLISDDSDSELGSLSDGYASDETIQAYEVRNQDVEGLEQQLQSQSISKATGYVNPMYSNQSKAEEVSENPIFEMRSDL